MNMNIPTKDEIINRLKDMVYQNSFTVRNGTGNGSAGLCTIDPKDIIDGIENEDNDFFVDTPEENPEAYELLKEALKWDKTMTFDPATDLILVTDNGKGWTGYYLIYKF